MYPLKNRFELKSLDKYKKPIRGPMIPTIRDIKRQDKQRNQMKASSITYDQTHCLYLKNQNVQIASDKNQRFCLNCPPNQEIENFQKTGYCSKIIGFFVLKIALRSNHYANKKHIRCPKIPAIRESKRQDKQQNQLKQQAFL